MRFVLNYVAPIVLGIFGGLVMFLSIEKIMNLNQKSLKRGLLLAAGCILVVAAPIGLLIPTYDGYAVRCILYIVCVYITRTVCEFRHFNH